MGLPATAGSTAGRQPPAGVASSPAAPSADDIAAAADAVVALLKAGQVAAGMQQLEVARRDRSQAVQDALDRYVSARSGGCFRPPEGANAEVEGAIRRVDLSMLVIRMPVQEQVALLTEAQKHDVYASIVEARGSREAIAALGRDERVILGLRNEQSSLSNRGQGDYNDRLVILWKRGGTRRLSEFLLANTEPTAQYDGNQRTNRTILFRRADGQDVTNDHVPELGRLSAGTYELLETTHHNPKSAGTNFSLRPTPGAVQAGAGRVERDTNHDGLFDDSDPTRFTDLNNTFKIHSGSRANTDSAGCQTIAPADFLRFATDVRGGTQTMWQYVLTRVVP